MNARRVLFRRRGDRRAAWLQLPRLKFAATGRRVWAIASCFALIGLIWGSAAYWHVPSGFYRGNPQLAGSGFLNRIISKLHPQTPKENFLGGLLVSDFNRSSCFSRYDAAAYRKPSPFKPSDYLLRKLRMYEAQHRRCGPLTESYKNTVKILKAGGAAEDAAGTGCKYLVWIPYLGLGNRILSLSSTFLYALLSERVLLVHQMEDFASLMCEPFPGTSWMLPLDFPITKIDSFGKNHPSSYGKSVKDRKIRDAGFGDSFLYLHLIGGFTEEDSYFFCEPDQLILREVPWLLVRSDEYFVPALFLNSIFLPELVLMFPEKEAVFHHLCRYLFHPSNEVWGMIRRYHETYLAKSGKTIGVQIRVFDEKEAPFDVVLRQVINCTLTQKLLPEIAAENMAAVENRSESISVLIASLYPGYSERIRSMYWEHPAANGQLVGVYQPSHEESQKTGNVNHDMKAWAEINLLSFSDMLVTTARSTFGYVSQALGGLTPWILLHPDKGTVPEPACVRDISMEPCFHSLPHNVCKGRKEAPYIATCKDVPWGIKLVSHTAT